MKKGIHVFIVEDALFLQEMLCRLFTKAGMKVVGTASSARKAFFQISSLKPELIWVDLVLPGGQNGITLINKIKQFYPEMTVIACSGLQQKQVLIQSEKTGITRFVNKPFKSDEALDKVFSVMKEKQQKEMVA
jgi:DNA-binding NtrC family response regulator